MLTTSAKTIEVFFSYSHQDQALRDKLAVQLTSLQREGLIAQWHDRKITGGSDWAKEIDTHLNTAQIILLLISADFIASDYCYEKEATRALKRHDAGQARVIPVILRPCDWQHPPLNQLQALPTDGKPVTSWRNQDEAFLNIVKGIRKVVSQIIASSTPTKTKSNITQSSTNTKPRLSPLRIPTSKSFNPYKTRDEWIEYLTENIQQAVEATNSLEFYIDNNNAYRYLHILHNNRTIYTLQIHKGTFPSRTDDGICFAYATHGNSTSSNAMNAWGKFEWNTDKEEVALQLHDMSLLSPYTTADEKAYTKEEFLQALWQAIKRYIENVLR